MKNKLKLFGAILHYCELKHEKITTILVEKKRCDKSPWYSAIYFGITAY
jgi:hypothetical protein